MKGKATTVMENKALWKYSYNLNRELPRILSLIDEDKLFLMLNDLTIIILLIVSHFKDIIVLSHNLTA